MVDESFREFNSLLLESAARVSAAPGHDGMDVVVVDGGEV